MKPTLQPRNEGEHEYERSLHTPPLRHPWMSIPSPSGWHGWRRALGTGRGSGRGRRLRLPRHGAGEARANCRGDRRGACAHRRAVRRKSHSCSDRSSLARGRAFGLRRKASSFDLFLLGCTSGRGRNCKGGRMPCPLSSRLSRGCGCRGEGRCRRCYRARLRGRRSCARN